MDKNFLELYDMKLQSKQRWLFCSFLINLIMIAIIWLLTFVPGVIWLGSIVTGLSVKMTHIAVIGALGLWGVFVLAFFLAPAIAIIRARAN